MNQAPDESNRAFPCIGKRAPHFVASTASGKISFPDHFYGNWVVFFSHLAAFSPVAPGDLELIRSIGEAYAKIGCRLVDVYQGNVDEYMKMYHAAKRAYSGGGIEDGRTDGLEDFENLFAIIDDNRLEVANRYGMGECEAPLPDEVSSFLIIDPLGTVRTLIMFHPDDVARIFGELLRIVIALKKTDEIAAAKRTIRECEEAAVSC